MLRNLAFDTLKLHHANDFVFKVDYSIIDMLSIIFSTN